jgi:hypothetical protein
MVHNGSTRNQNPNVTSKSFRAVVQSHGNTLCLPEDLGTANGEEKIERLSL